MQKFIQIGSVSLKNYNFLEKNNIEIYFKAPANANVYDWFVVDVHSILDDYKHPYVMINNISLVEVDHCTEPQLCSPTDGEINPTVPFQVPNQSDQLFQVGGLDNVYSATNIYIYNTQGKIVRILPDIYSINGIFNPITWNCKLSNGQTLQGTFFWGMVLENDCEVYKYMEKFVIVDEITDTTVQTTYNNVFQTPVPCCEYQPNIFLNDMVLSGEGELRYITLENIYINNVNIENDISQILFQAGNEIVISGEFSSGGNADFVIADCSIQKKNIFIDTVIYNKNINTDSLKTTDYETNNNSILFYPNPVKNILTIQSLFIHEKIISIRIFDILGQEVFYGNFNSQIETIDLSNLTNGIYFCTLKTSQGVVSKKIIKT